ncbi:MAG: BPL-N domain-containing protein [Candidatus Thorarchaeota archaeon]
MTIGVSKKKGIATLIVIVFAIGTLVLAIRFPTGMEGVRVAVYNDRGAMPSSSLALLNMFLWMNAEASYVNSTEIQQGVLDDYDIIVFPGGSSFDYHTGLGTVGRNALLDFVARGGSYFGICGGSKFGTDEYLGLFHGYASDAVNGSGAKVIPMIVNKNSTGPDLSNEPSTYDILYWNSGYFYSSNVTYMSTVIPITLYTQNNEPGMIACKYGNGTVFLSFPHPEYEENGILDGTDQFDYHNDLDSEWNLLLKVSLWLVEASR